MKNERENTMEKSLKEKLLSQEMSVIDKDLIRGAANDFYTMYRSYVEAGFTTKQSLELVKHIISESINVNRR